ncbi:hypothetical protein HU200_024075 [Digitaria exilis]|uniref:Uncharacterized protein n=1 Tax=Digitaria exilis TaxID=1010633 RepID=A0A835C6G5_9POAL|nr:hypothetical protein HU200_024075 [Digitaria exilis]
MAGAGGGAGATDEIPDVEMEVVERPPEEPGRVGSKRVWDSPSALGSYGMAPCSQLARPPPMCMHACCFYGVTTAEKKKLNKAGNVNHVHMNSDDASKILSNSLYSFHNIDSVAHLLVKIQRIKPKGPLQYVPLMLKVGATKEIVAPSSMQERVLVLQRLVCLHQLALKFIEFKDAEGSSKDELYRSLIHVYGEDNERLAHLADRHSTIPGVLQGLPSSVDDSLTRRSTAPINGLVQSLVHEQNHKSFMGRYIGLPAETYVDGRGTFPRFLDGGNFLSGVDKRNSLSDSHVSRTYLDVNTLNSDHQFRSFRPSVSSDPLQLSEKLSAYGGITENLPNTHQKELHSSHAPYGSSSLIGFRNPGYATSEISLASQTLRATSQLGTQSHHIFTTGIGKVNLHRYIDAEKGCGTSRPALLSSSSCEPSMISAEPLSPIKDEVWETSVPFIPSFDFPYSTSPPGKQYDPFVDCIESSKVGNTNNLKSSDISLNISSQHTNQYGITDKSLSRDDKLARNMHMLTGIVQPEIRDSKCRITAPLRLELALGVDGSLSLMPHQSG